MRKMIDKHEIVIPGYTMGDIRFLAYAAERRSLETVGSAAIPFMGIYPLTELICDIVKANNGLCACCGVRFESGKKHICLAQSMTVHRVIPLRGYVAGNVKVICKECNSIIGEGDNIPKIRKAIDWQEKALQEQNSSV